MKKKEKIKLSPTREEMLTKLEAKSAAVEELKKQNRSRMELWFDKHNHKMEFLRTFFGLVTIGLQLVILCKIFNII